MVLRLRNPFFGIRSISLWANLSTDFKKANKLEVGNYEVTLDSQRSGMPS
jgi:hypothetical protein